VKSIDQQIRELADLVKVADFNFRIWWIYANRDDRQKYADTMKKYPLVFQVGRQAHFAAVIATLYMLYETRRDTVNFSQVIGSFPQGVR
jgi:hypothetical protein